MEEWDSYVEELNRMGLDRYIELARKRTMRCRAKPRTICRGCEKSSVVFSQPCFTPPRPPAPAKGAFSAWCGSARERRGKTRWHPRSLRFLRLAQPCSRRRPGAPLRSAAAGCAKACSGVAPYTVLKSWRKYTSLMPHFSANCAMVSSGSVKCVSIHSTAGGDFALAGAHRGAARLYPAAGGR